MTAKSDDMLGTTMRVRRRTARYVDYLKASLKTRTGRDYSADDVLWEALMKAFSEDIQRADELWAGEQQDENN